MLGIPLKTSMSQGLDDGVKGRGTNVMKTFIGSAKTRPTRSSGFASQVTLKAAVRCSGIGLHGGRPASLTLKPAAPNTGIIFHRTDISGSAPIPARFEYVRDTRLCTTLGVDAGVTIGTVEHLMAALAGCHVDNVIIEVDGPEVPILDGSSEPFVSLIESVGTIEQAAPKHAIRIEKSVTVEDGDGRATLRSGQGFSVNIEVEYRKAAVKPQRVSLGLVNGTFKRELARARTFGFLDDIEKLRAAGFAMGGSLDNAVVMSGDRVLNEGGLRFADEFVRHKALDAVGDLYLAGATILGSFDGVRSGHGLNNRLLHALFEQRDAWSMDFVPAESSMGFAHDDLALEAPALAAIGR